MAFKEFILDMFQDERGSISHKRVVVSLGAISLCTAFLVHIPVNDHLADLIAGIVAAGMGFTTWDKYTKKDTE